MNGKPISVNGNIHILCNILNSFVTSAAEAKLGALFMNAKEGKVIWLILKELGHPQPSTPIHCDTKTAAGMVNDTVKKYPSCSMEMKFFWVMY